jgi:hypothetical protein
MELCKIDPKLLQGKAVLGFRVEFILIKKNIKKLKFAYNSEGFQYLYGKQKHLAYYNQHLA